MKAFGKNKLILLTLLLAACGSNLSSRLRLDETKSIQERAETYESKREQEQDEKSPGYFSVSDISIKPSYIQIKEKEAKQTEKSPLSERSNEDEFYFELPERFHRYGEWNWKPSPEQLSADTEDRLHKVILPKSAIPFLENNWVFEHFKTDFYELLELSWKEPDGSQNPQKNLGLPLAEGRQLVNSLAEYQELLNSMVSSLPVDKQIETQIQPEHRRQLRESLDLAQINEISPNKENLQQYCAKINRKALEFISSDTPLFFTSKIAKNTFDVIEPVEERSRLHFCVWLPLILQVNEETLKERDWLRRIYYKTEFQKKNLKNLEKIAKKYRIQAKVPSKEFFAEAFFKVDLVPPSMALSQVSLEGGWTKTYDDNGRITLGTRCNNYFSIYDFSKNRSKACKASRSNDYIKYYEHLIDSVRDYVTKVNSHPAYISSRLIRLHNRVNNNVSGAQMILGLSSYAEDPLYFRKLWWIMHNNHLDKYDDWYKFTPTDLQQP